MSGHKTGRFLPLVELSDDTEQGETLRRIVGERGRNGNFYRMVANSPAVGRTIAPLVWSLWDESRLGRRQVELAILRVSRLCEAEYEWNAHVPFARAAGVTQAQIAGVTAWRACAEFDERDRLMLEVVDHAVGHLVVPEDVMVRFEDEFTPGERVEILTIAGLYRAVAVMLRSFDIPVDAPTSGDARPEGAW